jgi:DNA-binding IclR family transcriptional regulator
MSQRERQTLDSLGRGLELLELIAQRGSVKLAELPELLGVSRATAFRVLTTLQARGFVDHVAAEHAYRLGPAPLSLASRSYVATLVRLAEPTMARLRERTGETVNLAHLRGGELTYVEILEGRHMMRMSARHGERVPLHCTALGKATLAALPEERRRELAGPEPYERFTPRSPATWGALAKQLRATEQRGYAIDDEEMDVDAVCIGAAVRGADGGPVGALSVAALAARLGDGDHASLGEFVRELAGEIGAAIARSAG